MFKKTFLHPRAKYFLCYLTCYLNMPGYLCLKLLYVHG
ncbi:putative membrane protein [Klebsiella pneumoniae]|nr:putative membrane protein [Klebsiella pneumoniae]